MYTKDFYVSYVEGKGHLIKDSKTSEDYLTENQSQTILYLLDLSNVNSKINLELDEYRNVIGKLKDAGLLKDKKTRESFIQYAKSNVRSSWSHERQDDWMALVWAVNDHNDKISYKIKLEEKVLED